VLEGGGGGGCCTKGDSRMTSLCTPKTDQSRSNKQQLTVCPQDWMPSFVRSTPFLLPSLAGPGDGLGAPAGQPLVQPPRGFQPVWEDSSAYSDARLVLWRPVPYPGSALRPLRSWLCCAHTPWLKPPHIVYAYNF
jgi:hypothetical protein